MSKFLKITNSNPLRRRLYEEPKYNVYELLYQIKGLKEQLATTENKDKAQQKELTDLRATEQALRQELVRRTIDLECAQRAEKQLTTQLEEINAELDQQKKKIADLTETIDLLRSRANTATAPKEATVNTLSDLLD